MKYYLIPIEFLWIDDDLGDVGLTYLGDALAVNTSLKCLDISGHGSSHWKDCEDFRRVLEILIHH